MGRLVAGVTVVAAAVALTAAGAAAAPARCSRFDGRVPAHYALGFGEAEVTPERSSPPRGRSACTSASTRTRRESGTRSSPSSTRPPALATASRARCRWQPPSLRSAAPAGRSSCGRRAHPGNAAPRPDLTRRWQGRAAGAGSDSRLCAAQAASRDQPDGERGTGAVGSRRISPDRRRRFGGRCTSFPPGRSTATSPRPRPASRPRRLRR